MTKKAEKYFKEGEKFFNLSQYSEAIVSFDKAIALNSDYAADAWFFRGDALSKLDRNEEAIVSFDKGIALNSDYAANVWYKRGNELLYLRRYEEAVASFDKAIALNSDYTAYAWCFRGLAFDSLRRYEEAIASFDKAIAILPDYSFAWNIRGDTFYNLRRYTEAVDSYNKAISINPDDAEAWFFREYAPYDLLLYSEAVDSYAAVNDNEEMKIFKDHLLDILEIKYEPIFTKLTKTGNLQYVENFCKKFPNRNIGTPEFEKLHLLLEKKRYSLDDKKLNIVIKIITRKEASKKFKEKMFHNNPKTPEDLIRNFLDVFGESYEQYIHDILKILRQDFNYGDQDINLDISKIQKDIELDNFGSYLLSSSQSGKQFSIDDVDTISGYGFEILLKGLFESMGYTVEHTNLSNDQGADLILEKHGERIVVQAKNWTSKVGNSAIQEIVASINHYKASKSIVISSSGFTNPAIALAHSNNVELWDRNKLAKILNQNPILKK